MKTSPAFKDTIKAYLDNRAVTDTLFAVTYQKEGKNIDDCITYILNTVQKSGCNGFTDDEIYSMAVHYYDEDEIEIGKTIDVKVVVNHTVELTEEEKQEAKEMAKQKAIDDALKEIHSTAKPQKTIKIAHKENVDINGQQSLFL